MRKTILITLAATSLLLTGCVQANQNLNVDKNANECNVNADCQYIWLTDGCYTPEYIKYTTEEAEKKGIHLGSAGRERQGVICVCKDHKCAEK